MKVSGIAVLYHIFWASLMSLPQSNAQKTQTTTPQNLTGTWKVAEAQIGTSIKGSLRQLEESEVLAIKEDNFYYLDGVQQGIWKLTRDKRQIMFISGKMEGLWEIESLEQGNLVLSITFDGADKIKERMVRLYLIFSETKNKD